MFLPRVLLFLFNYSNFTQWLQHHLLVCPSKKFLHMECPGCGMQRSLLALMQGDFPASWSLYPATVPILLLMGFTLLHLKCRFAMGATIIKYSFVVIAIVIAVFYIYKIVNHKIIA